MAYLPKQVGELVPVVVTEWTVLGQCLLQLLGVQLVGVHSVVSQQGEDLEGKNPRVGGGGGRVGLTDLEQQGDTVDRLAVDADTGQ